MHFKSASVVCSGWAGARPPRAPSAPEPLRAACLPVFAAGGKTWCSGTVGQPLRHGAVRILVLRPPLRAGLAAGPGRAGRPGNASLSCRCSQLFKEARATPRAGRRGGARPAPTAPWPCPRLCPLCCCRWFLGCRGWGGVRDTCASSPSLAGFRSPLRRPPACQPAQLGSGLQGPESLVRGGPACFCLSCPLCAAAAGAGGHHSPESALPVAGPGPGPGPARQCSLSPGVEPAAGFHGEPHGRGRGCHKSGNIGHREDGRLATSLGIAAVSTLGTTQAGPPAVHH